MGALLRAPFSAGEELLREVRGLLGAGPIYAVLDGARDERIATWVRAGDAPWACLYAGNVPRELVHVAPYLVRLRDGHENTLRLLGHARGNAWGIFAQSDVPLADLRRHLRRFLRVASEDGRRTMLFRFYDPRVLRLYLPTCTPRERRDFFGPIPALAAESRAGPLDLFLPAQ